MTCLGVGSIMRYASVLTRSLRSTSSREQQKRKTLNNRVWRHYRFSTSFRRSSVIQKPSTSLPEQGDNVGWFLCRWGCPVDWESLAYAGHLPWKIRLFVLLLSGASQTKIRTEPCVRYCSRVDRHVLNVTIIMVALVNETTCSRCFKLDRLVFGRCGIY